jgi:hypothetical protein
MFSGDRDHWISHWNREGGPLDIIAIAVALVVIVGGYAIFHKASQEYTTTARAPSASDSIPVPAPTIVPLPGGKPQQ